jgi:hypothetical protein
MSNFKLGIFNDLQGYLTAAYTECGGSVDKCDPSKAYSKYYLQKYYKPKAHSLRDEDVAPQFTNAVVKFAQKLATFDKSVGASPTLKQLMLDVAKITLDKIVVDNTDKDVAALVDNLKTNLMKDVAPDATDGVKDGKLKDTLRDTLLTDLESAIKTTSGLISADITNAVTCLKATTGKKVDGTGCSSLKTLLEEKILTPEKYAMDTSVGTDFKDPDEVRKQVKKIVVKFVLDKITDWINANYDVSAITVTGKETNVAEALKALKEGSLNSTELGLFNNFFVVMKKNTDGSWSECNSDEIDPIKASEFRINAKMTDLDGSRVPSIVTSIPKVTVGTNIGFNGGNVSIKAADEDTLKKVFQNAYSDPKVTMLPGFDKDANSELRPDLESIFSEILMRKTTPEAHVADSETSKIAKILHRWQRVGEDVWEHTLADGVTKVTIRPGSSEFDAEVASEVANCAAIGFSKDHVKCASFLRGVALDNPSKLAEVALELTDEVVPKVVANLHPKFALAILKSFGFHRKMCKDKVAGRQIEKIQSAAEWIEKFINKKFTDPATVEKIKGNQKLVNFLNLLSQLVNANPSVLNDGMVTETEESRGEINVPDDLVARKIKPAKSRNSGKPVLGWGEIQSNMNKVYGSFSRGLTFNGSSTNSPFGMDNLFPQMSMLTGASVVRGSTWGGMAGGGTDVKVFLQDHQTGLEYSRNVQTIIDELLANLRTSGKTFSKADLDAISKKKADFEVMERDLFETAWNIQKYSQLLKVVESENRPQIITTEHVEQYVEKYNGLLNRYEKTGNSFNTLISLLKDCSEDGEKGDNCKTL